MELVFSRIDDWAVTSWLERVEALHLTYSGHIRADVRAFARHGVARSRDPDVLGAFARSFDFPREHEEIERDRALRVLGHTLATGLFFGESRMSPYLAAELALGFVELFDASARYFTSSWWADPRSTEVARSMTTTFALLVGDADRAGGVMIVDTD